MTDHFRLLRAADKLQERAHRRTQTATSLTARRKWYAREQRLDRFCRWLILTHEFDPAVNTP